MTNPMALRRAAAGLLGAMIASAALCALSAPALAGEHSAAARPQHAAMASRARSPQTGTASWYGQEHAGRRTASGATFDPGRLTAAHASFPLGTKVCVTHLRSGRTVIVTINDRGPYVRGRIIDLSEQAARQLGMLETGLAKVRLKVM